MTINVKQILVSANSNKGTSRSVIFDRLEKLENARLTSRYVNPIYDYSKIIFVNEREQGRNMVAYALRNSDVKGARCVRDCRNKLAS